MRKSQFYADEMRQRETPRGICEGDHSRKSRIRLSSQTFRFACLALATLALVSGPTFAAGASSAHSKQRSALLVPPGQKATVTGFVSTTYFNPPSGPISVRLNRSKTTQLVGILNGLPVIKYVGCMENALIYKIVFRSTEHSRSDYEVNAYACDAVVQIRGVGKVITRRDSTCSLVRIIHDDLPAKARGTKASAIGCNA
jgi:hypothetical protein